MTYDDRLRKEDWYVAPAPIKEAKEMVRQYHYSKGCSNTAVYVHGLYKKSDNKLYGVALWLPPTKVACESVNKERWTKVLSLSRLVVVPGVPKNACSFLMSRSISLIKEEGRFVSLVTYADFSQGHTGGIYKATNWVYLGETKGSARWLDQNGKQVAIKSTKNRTAQQMRDLGYINVGVFKKHKFILHLENK